MGFLLSTTVVGRDGGVGHPSMMRLSRRCRQTRHPCRCAALSSLLFFLVLASLFHSDSCLVHEAANTFVLPTTDRAPLRRDDPTSPYALTLRVQPFSPLSSPSSPTTASEPTYNFLATQVWPSARVAARAVETYLPSDVVTMCEFGCGPGLPSLAAAQWAKFTAATHGNMNQDSKQCSLRRVIATDVDSNALELVKQAAAEQKLDSIVTVQPFDLVGTSGSGPSANDNTQVPLADLYLLADVFESSHVARGAARITAERLLCKDAPSACHVWVFAQTDRAQREVYLVEMKRLLADESLSWTSVESGPPTTMAPDSGPSSRLWLCDVDETRVKYWLYYPS